MTTATTTATATKKSRARKVTRLPYPKMPTNWFALYIRRNSFVNVDAEKIAREVQRSLSDRLSDEHRDTVYLYLRESILGDWTALVALADILSDAPDFDPADKTHPAVLALNTAALALERHLQAHPQYRAKRRRTRSGGPEPLRAYDNARSAAARDIATVHAVTLEFIADRIRHGEEA